MRLLAELNSHATKYEHAINSIIDQRLLPIMAYKKRCQQYNIQHTTFSVLLPKADIL